MDDRPFVSLMSRVEVFDDVLCDVVVLFMTTVCDRPSCGAVTVVRLLGGEPISCDLKRLLFRKPWEDVSGTILRTVCGHLSVSPCPSLTGREKRL